MNESPATTPSLCSSMLGGADLELMPAVNGRKTAAACSQSMQTVGKSLSGDYQRRLFLCQEQLFVFYIQHTYTTHTLYVHYTYNTHTLYIQYMYNIYTVSIKYMYGICMVYIQFTCSIHTVYVQYTYMYGVRTVSLMLKWTKHKVCWCSWK